LGLHGFPKWLGEVRVMAPQTVLFATVLYAGIVDDKPKTKRERRTWIQLIAAGIVGGLTPSSFLGV
jgi:hypothetical protein